MRTDKVHSMFIAGVWYVWTMEVSGSGETLREAVTNFSEALDEWMFKNDYVCFARTNLVAIN